MEPTRRALRELRTLVLLTGRRQSQGGARRGMPLVELAALELVRVNPLAKWTYDEVWAYLDEHAVPCNPLYSQGYRSIGDTMTTAKSDKGERAGRFQGTNETECGMHSLAEREHDPAQQQGAQTWEQQARVRADALGMATLAVEAELDRALAQPPVLLHFYSPFCPHCRKFEQSFNLAAQVLLSASVRVCRVDVRQLATWSAAAQRFVVTKTPTHYAKVHNATSRYTGKLEALAVLAWFANLTG